MLHREQLGEFVPGRSMLKLLIHCLMIYGADLKPENFLLKDRTGSIAKDNLRAIDFGLSTVHHSGNLKQIVGSGEFAGIAVRLRPRSGDALTKYSQLQCCCNHMPTIHLCRRIQLHVCSVLSGA